MRQSSTSDSSAFAIAVREHMARRRLSRQQLADQAKISISTLEKALSGKRPFTLATMVRVEDALGAELRPKTAINSIGGAAIHVPSIAPDELGSYARPSVQFLEGGYLTVMPSLGERSAVYAYRTDIGWDAARACLAFHESERVDAAFTHFGTVSMPNQTGHIYLSTNRHGQHRLAILSRPGSTGDMHGLLLTLHAGRGAQLTPVAAPIVLIPIVKGTTPSYGRIAAGQASYAKYRASLKRTLDDHFALFAGH
jgi:transcriptional regulator with XRE-family HTH domain